MTMIVLELPLAEKSNILIGFLAFLLRTNAIVNIPYHIFFMKHLCNLSQRVIILLSHGHRRKTAICCTDTPVVPIDDEVLLDQSFPFTDGHSLRVIPPVQEFLLHPGPHCFTARILSAISSYFQGVFRCFKKQ